MTEKIFNRRLRYRLQAGLSVKTKSWLRENLILACKDNESLLHYAAKFNSDEIASYLIKLGANVDQLRRDGKSPLMIAVERRSSETARVLLEAGANIDITNANGHSALQMTLQCECKQVVDIANVYGRNALQMTSRCRCKHIFRVFRDKLQSVAMNTEDLIAKLTAAGCVLYHVAHLADLVTVRYMLNNGVDISSSDQWGRTALHAAAELNDTTLAKFLMSNGADVDALDAGGKSALFVASCHVNRGVLQLLLEYGANPNIPVHRNQETPLYALVTSEVNTTNVSECMELLFEYGAIPRNLDSSNYTILHAAWKSVNSERANYLIDHLALLQKMGTEVDKPLKCCNAPKHKMEHRRLENHYERSKQVLETVIFQKLSLFDLLTDGDFKMKTYVRNELFILKIKEVFTGLQLSESHPYYYNLLVKRINKVADIVRLENIATPIVCGFFHSNENEGYIAARKTVGYLSKCDLEHLIEV